MKIFVIIIFLVFTASCEIEKPEKSEYEPFVCSEFPESRVFFPEEKISFVFNMDVNPNSLSGFTVKEISSENEIPVEISGDTVSILPPLPAESSLSVTISSALKSIDNRPLMTGDGFSENKELFEITFETGVKLPEIETIIPSENQSSTVAIKFDGNIEIKFKDVDPVPSDMMKIEDWIVIVYDEPVGKINISKATAVERDTELEDISVTLPSKKPEKGDLSVEYSASDTEIIVTISDESAIAVSVNGVNFMCEKKCSAVLKDLLPETYYSVNTDVYTTTGKKHDTAEIITGEEKPHVIISEVMHTPSLEPEKNWEFVEIFNSGNIDFDLENCFIDDKNDGKGIDPLILKDPERNLILQPGELAVITGNEAAFSDVAGSALWLIVDDTTIADAGLTSTETIQIICNRNDLMVLEAHADPSGLKTERGYSFNSDKYGNICSSSVEGGTPGKYYECD
ncbi:MAG TPA: lamin tail domain-containing protein [bacterium]|nr:lamin tail domain-containing protein [bacterium]HNW15332.1 lamin tail domain-containing protein [bacterium]HOG44195.1 lamin tail domain-containing protein [bacterium]HPA55979.1 lamin tail domain-containing protein [bacterium]HPG34792.1 lamin tail domain-containing protein [bacterium]